MKITGTRSYILIEYDHRTVKVRGELTTSPAFYADINSMQYWESPYENQLITADEKNAIIQCVLENNSPDFKIIFE
jgi:hypothetical protein